MRIFHPIATLPTTSTMTTQLMRRMRSKPAAISAPLTIATATPIAMLKPVAKALAMNPIAAIVPGAVDDVAAVVVGAAAGATAAQPAEMHNRPATQRNHPPTSHLDQTVARNNHSNPAAG